MKKKTKLYLYLIPITLFLLLESCKKDKPVEPPPPQPVLQDTITVVVEQVTHRSISMQINKKLQIEGDTYHLYRIFENNIETEGIYSIAAKDTFIIDDNDGLGLLLDTTYSYCVVRFDSLDEAKDSSNTVTAKTLATTSHDYTWQEITIGEWQSDLRDVWGTDENNVYAVGTVTINDTTYGILKWNGIEWKPELKIGGRNAIFGFSENDIWEAGGSVWHYDGTTWSRIDGYSSGGQSFPLDQVLFDNKPYTSVWGTSSENLYFGSDRGKIIYWDGMKASIVANYDDFSIIDMNGSAQNNIWAVGSKLDTTFSSKIVYFNGSIWEADNSYPGQNGISASVYTLNRKETYIVGGNIYSGFHNNWSLMPDPTNIVISRVRGLNSNNIFACGSFNMVMHYNGLEWFFYDQLYQPSGGALGGIYMTANKTFIVGRSDDSRAKILIGTKN